MDLNRPKIDPVMDQKRTKDGSEMDPNLKSIFGMIRNSFLDPLVIWHLSRCKLRVVELSNGFI